MKKPFVGVIKKQEIMEQAAIQKMANELRELVQMRGKLEDMVYERKYWLRIVEEKIEALKPPPPE